MTESVTVIGAGISGLTAALELKKRGFDVTLLEAGDEVGGVIRSVRDEDGSLHEQGPNSFPSTADDLLALARELGIAEQIIEARDCARTRLIYHRHELREVPTSPRELLKSTLFNRRQKLRFLLEPFVPARRSESPESVAHFFARRFGPAPARTLVDAFVSGIYAGDARRLGIRSAFPMLWDMEQKSGSILRAMRKRKKKNPDQKKLSILSFRDGMATLPQAIARELGGAIRLNSSVRAMTYKPGSGWELQVEEKGNVQTMRAARVLIAAPAHVAGMLLTRLSPMAADILMEIDHAPIISVQAAFPESEIPRLPEAFGYLVPRPSRMRTLGWLFNSQTFEGRAPEGSRTMNGFIGGASDRTAISANEPALQHILLGELSLALGMRRIPQPSYIHFSRWQPGLPQYNVGYHRRIEAVRLLLAELPTLQLAGNYLKGISLNDCVKTAKEAVTNLLALNAGEITETAS